MSARTVGRPLERVAMPSDEAFCHEFLKGATFSLCGVPRAEQTAHGEVDRDTAPCPGCGLMPCPACEAVA